ncbi:MAG TPA: hypothetical protein VF746_31450 [Longimicrobium sp.]|jgi:hypothetical protein
MRTTKSGRTKPRSAREQAMALAGAGAHAHLRGAAHATRVVPNRKRERARRACRDWR